jgi:hypothetical protein
VITLPRATQTESGDGSSLQAVASLADTFESLPPKNFSVVYPDREATPSDSSPVSISVLTLPTRTGPGDDSALQASGPSVALVTPISAVSLIVLVALVSFIVRRCTRPGYTYASEPADTPEAPHSTYEEEERFSSGHNALDPGSDEP